MALIKINGTHGAQSFATAEDIQSVTNLDNLHDVAINGSLADGQYLVYNASINNWENVNTPAVVSVLDDLTDVDTTGKLNNYVLTWDSGANSWEAAPADHYTDSDVDAHLNTGTATATEVLSWTGTDYDWVPQSAGTIQTLSFSTPDLTISGTGGNTVDLSALTTTSLPFSSITSTPTTIAGYGITDAFDGQFGSLTNTPTTIGGYGISDAYTSSQVDALPVSTFTNDAGYLTSETDSQTLTFTSPNSLAISNGNTVNLSTLEVGEIDGGTY